jgi:hypothetical protein
MKHDNKTSVRAERSSLARLLLPMVAWAGLALHSTTASPQESGDIQVGANSIVAAPITAGQIFIDVPIPVSALTSLQVQAIVPVTGASVTLRNPSGAVVIASNDPAVSFLSGAGLDPPLPGGQFTLPSVANPVNGAWTLRLEFPAAPVNTVALVTALAESRYQVGVALADPNQLTNRPFATGMIVLDNGQPVLGLQPALTITQVNGAVVANLNPVDDGSIAAFDGQAGDGLYSAPATLTAAGEFLIKGTVSFNTPGGLVTRTAAVPLSVDAPVVAAGNISSSITRGPLQCARSLDVVVPASATAPATYVTVATLTAAGGSTIRKNVNRTLTGAGSISNTVSFTSKEIRQRLGAGGDFTVGIVDILAFLEDHVSVESRKLAPVSFTGTQIGSFCADPIEIGQATITPVPRNSYIGSLQVDLPIAVTAAGSYQVSFKVTDGTGNDVGQVGLTQNFAAGANNVRITVDAQQLQNSDGPFAVESVLVLGGSTTAQASQAGSGGATLSRWQFYPRILGDLNADGAVNAADRDLDLSFRNQPALAPGDRRDLNRDRVIDIRDAREITNRACGVGSCPLN